MLDGKRRIKTGSVRGRKNRIARSLRISSSVEEPEPGDIVASIPSPSQLPDDSAPSGLFGWMVAFIIHIGTVVLNGYDAIIRAIMALGAFALFALRTLRWMFSRLPRRGTVWPNFYEVGVKSLPVVALTGTFIGMVLAVQSYFQFKQIGLETRLGGVINMTLLRELGPVLAATMLAGRVGSAMAAELGTMRVTQQIDALAAMGVNPVHYLVVPRFMACLFLIPTLTVMADFMGVAGGHFYSVNILGIDIHHYWHNSA